MNWIISMIPLPWRIGIVAVGVVGLLAGAAGAYVWVDHQGYARAAAVWSAKYDAREAQLAQQRADEAMRQDKANEQAEAAEQAAIADYQKQIADLDALAGQLEQEAAADPAAKTIGLDAGAVSRLNRIK